MLALLPCDDYDPGLHTDARNADAVELEWTAETTHVAVRASAVGANGAAGSDRKPLGCMAVAGDDLVVQECAADAASQEWRWVPVGGRHKAYGQFMHVPTSACFMQTAPDGTKGTIVGLAACLPAETLPCGQVWTVSPHLERVAKLQPRHAPLVANKPISNGGNAAPKILCWVLT